MPTSMLEHPALKRCITPDRFLIFLA